MSLVRSVVEELSAAASYHTPLLTEAYGANVFKCPILACSRFKHGFKTRKMRDEHQNTHRRRFECTNKGCEYSTLGFSTNRELVKHLLVHAPTPDEVVFSKVQRCPLKKSLEGAIDKDDSISVGALAAEVLALETKETGFLLRAIKKGSCRAAKILMEVLGTEEISHKDRSGKSLMHFVSEIGNEEIAKVLIAAGANTKAQTQNRETPLTIAASYGHAHIIRLLFNQDIQRFDMDVAVGLYSLKKSLCLAARGGHEEVLRILLDTNRAAYVRHGIFYEAIQEAALVNYKSTMKLLLERGRELNAEGTYPADFRHLAQGDIATMVQHIMVSFNSELVANWEKLPMLPRRGTLNKYCIC